MFRHAEAIYCYSSQPRTVASYRPPRCICKGLGDEEECVINYGNIMYDRRIVRGSTYGRKVITDRGCPDYSKSSQRDAKTPSRREPVEGRVPGALGDEVQLGTPISMQGRHHKFMQTEVIMHELLNFGNTVDAQCQTDPFVLRPPKPFFTPAKTGSDMETQVLPEELFHFDVEVSAPVWVLVGNVMEQSMVEVMEEEELASLWEQQNVFLENRLAERAEEERLEEAEKKHREEKQKQMKLKEEILKLERETLDKLACRVYSLGYLSNLIPAVFAGLTKDGYFYDTVERDVELGFLPWLMSIADERLRLDVAARTIIDHLLCKAVNRKLKGEAEVSEEPTTPRDDEEDFEEDSLDIDDDDDADSVAAKTKAEFQDYDMVLTD